MRATIWAGAIAVALSGATALPAQETMRLGGVESAAQVAPADGGAAIELANAYWMAGHHAQARETYRRALDLDNVMLELPGGDAIWSHKVAQRMLASEVALTAR